MPTTTKKEKEAPRVKTEVHDGETSPAELEPPKADLPAAPAAAAPEEKTTEPEEKPTERTGLLKVTAKQFIQAKGIRWERAAGFLHWSTRKYGAGHLLTVPEWTKVHEGFMATPVGR